jgi:hypothetical protein
MLVCLSFFLSVLMTCNKFSFSKWLITKLICLNGRFTWILPSPCTSVIYFWWHLFVIWWFNVFLYLTSNYKQQWNKFLLSLVVLQDIEWQHTMSYSAKKTSKVLICLVRNVYVCIRNEEYTLMIREDILNGILFIIIFWSTSGVKLALDDNFSHYRLIRTSIFH